MAGLPVDLATAREKEPRLPIPFVESLENVAHSSDVSAPAPFRIMLAPEHPGDRREMDDAIASLKGVPDTPEAPYVSVLTAGSQKIQPDDLRSPRLKHHAECTADQPLGAGDQDAVTRVHRNGQAPVSRRLPAPGRRAFRQCQRDFFEVPSGEGAGRPS